MEEAVFIREETARVVGDRICTQKGLNPAYLKVRRYIRRGQLVGYTAGVMGIAFTENDVDEVA